MTRSSRTLRARLSWWLGGLVCAVLLAFAGAIYVVLEIEEANEPAAVKALEPPDETGTHLLLTLALALPLALAAAVGGGALITRRALRGLEETARFAGTLGVDDLARRLALPAGEAAEVVRVQSALNDMLARLERSVAGMRRFTADASHELRTPLARLMGELEVTLRRPRDAAELTGTLESTLEELARVSRLVDTLLTLARSDSGQLALARARVDAVAVTRAALEPYEAVLAAREVALTWRAQGAAPLDADALWLGRAVANLVDNAAKFTPAGGAVEVGVGGDAASVEIYVADSGPGLAAEDLPRLFERFYRGQTARGTSEGFGLGLALARDVARALGGDLTAANQPSGGACFRLTLPRAS